MSGGYRNMAASILAANWGDKIKMPGSESELSEYRAIVDSNQSLIGAVDDRNQRRIC